MNMGEVYTQEQKDIIFAEDQNILCVANAGTGKTYTLVTRVARLIKEKGVKPEEIMLTSFSRAANGELQKKIRENIRKLEKI
jgi:ATP-dependent exoDNAse (exonuclease V) beta subunit